ncbi:MAG: prepilin peptidase [bacterium]
MIVIFGLLIGSFLNVCIHRLSRGESIVFPPSHCPNCGAKLTVWELIPVFSYLYLRGKCRHCQGTISPRYPIVEILTALFFVYIWRFVGHDLLLFVIYAAFISLLLMIFFIDLENQLIPDSLCLIGVGVGLVHGLITSQIENSLLGILIGVSLLLLIKKLGEMAYKKEVMGEGDIFLIGMIGAFLGWQLVLLAIFLAYLLAAAVAFYCIFRQQVKLGSYIPFGPALAGGAVIAIFWGKAIISWYFGIWT